MDVVDLDSRGIRAQSTDADVQRPTQTLEMVATLCGFVLVIAAQWFPWFDIHASRTINPAAIAPSLSRSTMTVIDAADVLTVPYYLGWFAVFGLSAATALASAGARRVCAALGLGMLAAQALVVLAILQHTAPLPAAGLTITRTTGAYLAAAALIVFAILLIGSLRGQVSVPKVRDLRDGLAALTHHPQQTDADADAGDDETPVAYGRFTAVEATEVAMFGGSPTAVPIEACPTAPDHSMYRRPAASREGHAAPDKPAGVVTRGGV